MENKTAKATTRMEGRLIEEFGVQYAPLRDRVKEVINDIRRGEGLPEVD